MKINKNIITAVIIASLGVSSIASADSPTVPAIYDNGPASPRLNMTDMRVTEKVAFSLYEALMQSQEAQIYANGCIPSTVGVTAYMDQFGNDLTVNETNGMVLTAIARLPSVHFGQSIDVRQNPASGLLNGKVIDSVRGLYSYNNKNNLMVNERTALRATGQRGRPDSFRSSVIKDFYRGNTYGQGSFYEIYDYGLQVLSKNGYPVNKYWQRSVAIRDNGETGCTVFVKDRLVGATACRITISTTGYSQPSYFDQTGTLKVEAVTPSIPSADLEACTL